MDFFQISDTGLVLAKFLSNRITPHLGVCNNSDEISPSSPASSPSFPLFLISFLVIHICHLFHFDFIYFIMVSFIMI